MLRLKPNPGGSVVKNPPASAGAAGSTVPILELGRSPAPPTPVFLPGESHGQRSLGGYSPGGLKELDTTGTTEHTHNTGKTIQCRGIQEYLAMEKVVKVCAMSLWSHGHPSHSHLLCSVLYPTSPRLLPSSFWLESLSGTPTGEWGKKEDWGWRICLLGSLSAGLLPPHWPLTRGPADLSVSRLWCFLLWPLQTQSTAAPTAPSPTELALSLVISSLPANTFVNSPLNKFSNYTIWVYHLFLVGLWLDTRLFIKIKVLETLTQRKSAYIPQRLLWATETSQILREGNGKGWWMVSSSSPSSIPSLIPSTSFQLLF